MFCGIVLMLFGLVQNAISFAWIKEGTSVESSMIILTMMLAAAALLGGLVRFRKGALRIEREDLRE